MSKKILSILLALIMLLSLAAPIIPVSAATEVSATASETPTSDLRFGVLSDIHISYDYVDEVYGNVSGFFNGVQPSRFEKALRFFKAKGVEAVVVAGDLQEASGTDAASLDKQKDWLQTVVDIWFKVFTEAPGEEGYVEPIFTYGNHDSALISAQYWPEEWGTYEDAFIKTVNGYSFVCTHNAKEALGAPLLEKAAAVSQDKPLFYIQHCPVNNTVPGSTGGYGVGYGQTGRANLANYPNAVSFNGHTHAPLTDERSIWQGDAGNESQFTIINTATINYTGIGYDNDMTVNSYAGNAQQTEHGMIVDVTGSDVAVNRYSFNDMTIDTATGAVSGNAVKIGETWAWDACDVTDRPYAWDSRKENAHAPVFADGAAMTVNTITDSSVTVSIPAASLTAPAGFSDMISSYVVEACNPTSGEVEATGRIATSFHVDDKADVYQSSYTVTVAGLKAGTAYKLNVYAQEFFGKRSQALTADVTTTGTLAVYRRGDVNKDGIVDAADMTALEAVLANPSTYNYDGDIDLNGINETRDITELQAILDGKKITYPETGDLMDRVTKVTLTGVSTSANYQPVDYGTTIQNQVVRGDSKQAVKTWTTNYAYYPVTTMYFDEPIDLSGYTHLSFDTLFENEYNLSDSYRKRWLSVSFVSGDQEQIASYGSMNFDANNEGWTTKTISLATLKNIDLTAVTGIRFSHNFDYYEGRYDGVTEHGIYWDNFYGLVIEGADSDLLNGATITGGDIVFGAGFTNNTNQAIQSTGGTMDFTFESAKVMTDYAGIKVDMRTPVTTDVQVQALDADGNVVGSAVSVSSCNIYRSVNISVPAMGLEEGTVVSGLRFTYTCESLLLDNMQLQGSKDYDLIGTATGFTPVGGESCNAFITTEGGNGSNNALYASAAAGTSVWNGGGELTYETPLDLSRTPFLRFDMKVQNAHWALGLVLYNSNGEEIWRATHYNATSSGGQYATYEFDLRTYRTYEDGYTYHDVTAEQLKDVAKIRLTCDLASSPNWMTSDDTALREVWFDNLVACNPLEDFFGADTSLTKPSAVQDGFVCEIMPTTADGHTDVLHWYADSSKNAGTTSAWPGETIVSFTKDVNLMNHSGYEGSYDYLEFDIKTTGMYIAMYLTVKDENGANLGSTGEYRISYEQEWSTFRVDAAALGMSAEDFNKIAQVQIGWNWQHQNSTGTSEQYMADVYIDNMGLRAIDAESEDLLDQVSLIRNADWWTGANGKFTGGGWKYQSDVTANSDKAFMFYRSETSQNIGYGDGKTLYLYFNEPITLESKWSLEIDAIKHNYNANGGHVQLIGSDGNKYTVFNFTHTEAGVHTYSTLVGSIAGFDPTTTTVTGLYFKYPMNPDSSMDKAADGYMALDNLNIAIPEPMDEDDFLYTATCSIGQNQTAVTNNSLSSWKISPTANNWTYPQFVLANAADISNHTLTFDFMHTGLSSFRMHLANVNGDWGANSGGAQHYDESGKWYTVSYDLSGNGAGITEMTAFSLGIECTLAEGTEDFALYIDNVTLTDNDAEPEPTEPEPTEPEPTEPEKLDGLDIIGVAESVVVSKENAFESGFVFETLDSVDGHENVVHMYSDPANGGGYTDTSNNYFGARIYLPADAEYDVSGVDYLELKFNNTNLYCDNYYIHVYDADGNVLGSAIKRMAMTSDWSSYRLDLATLGLTEEELSSMASIMVRANWSKQLTTAATPVAGELYIDDLTFGSYADDSTDMFDHIASIQNVEWWWSGNNTYGGAGWILDEDAQGNSTFTIYRDTVVDKGTGYSPRRQYLYFDQAVTLNENTIVYIDATNTYMSTASKISFLGSDGNKYGYLNLNQAGTYHYQLAVSDMYLLNADTHMTVTTTPIDVASVQIIGVILHNDYFGGDMTYEGTLVMDNFVFGVAPNCMEDHLATAPGVRRPTSGIEDGYVIEILDSYEGYENVFHVNADPNNGGGTTTNWPDQPSYYVGESGANYSAEDYDYYEFTFKGTGHYSDISVSFLDGNNTTLGSKSGFRVSHKDSGWMTFRIPLEDAGLTADEVKQVRRVSFGFNWQYQNSTGTALLEADLYWRDCGFRSLNGESTDLLDQIDDIKNSDYWYGGYNNYPDAGWYFDEDGAFTFYRSTNTSGMGYNPRNMYTYFRTPVTVKAGQRLSLDIVNTNFPLSSKVELIGSDGKYYVFGNANQKGSYNLTVCVNDLVATDSTAFDPATVTIKGIKFYNNFNPDSNIDSTAGGTLAYTSLTVLEALPNSADDMFAQFKSLKGPTAVQENFVTEYIEEMEDGRTDVIRIAATTDNGLTTSNWPGNTKVYIETVPNYVDTTGFDYFEFTVKNTGIKYALYITLYDANGTSLGATGEFRMSNGCDWATHRVDLTTMGLTAEEIYQVACVDISVSWEYQNASGSTKQAGELLCDNFRFGSVVEDSIDLMDHVVKTDLRGSGATTKYPGSSWYFNEDGAFVITRDSTSTGWVTMRLYFDEAITAGSDWTVSCGFDITNFHHGGTISLIGSDGKVYSSVGPNKGGQNTVSKAVTAFASSGTAFDPATVQIVGIHISYSLGTSTAVTDTTAGGYMSIDNLIFTDPSAE